MVELAPEAADEELFEIVNTSGREHGRPGVTGSNLDHAHNAQVAKGRGGQLDRIIEKLAQEINARFSLPQQHDLFAGPVWRLRWDRATAVLVGDHFSAGILVFQRHVL